MSIKTNNNNRIVNILFLPIFLIMLSFTTFTSAQEKMKNTDEVSKKSSEVFTVNDVDALPLFLACENLKKDQEKKCFATEMSKIVSENFNLDLANKLNMKGKVKIVSQFEINKNGELEHVKVKAPHEDLVEETKRVLKLVPKLKPAMKNGKPVSIGYALPIQYLVK